MQKALITGVSGFVGPYLVRELSKKYEVFGIDRTGDETKNVFRCDLLDKKSVIGAMQKIKPDLIFHLAGFSSVKASWEKSKLCFDINVGGTKNLLDAILACKLKPRVLIVTSAEVYGNPKKMPMRESDPLSPENPYAKSRVAQEKLLKKYKNIDWIISRSFNHTGPGQPPIFVIPEFTKQIAEIKKGLCEPIMSVGNLKAKRDFSDVRDVVRAYRLLLEKGKTHEIYNVCSGIAYKIGDLLTKIIKISNKKVAVKIDHTKFRPTDAKELRGDDKKIAKLGFKRKFEIEQTLRDSSDWWMANVKKPRDAVFLSRH